MRRSDEKAGLGREPAKATTVASKWRWQRGAAVRFLSGLMFPPSPALLPLLPPDFDHRLPRHHRPRLPPFFLAGVEFTGQVPLEAPPPAPQGPEN